MDTFDSIIDNATHDLVQKHGFTDPESLEYKTVFEDRRKMLVSDFEDKVDLNNVTVAALSKITDLITTGVIKDTKQTAIVSISNVRADGFLPILEFVKNNQELEYHKLGNHSQVLISNLSPYKALQLSESLKNNIVYITLSKHNLEKYGELMQKKVITISSDAKLYKKDKVYKINVRVAANVPANEANRRKDHYADVMLKLAKGLKQKGYEAFIGTSGGNVGHSLTMYSDDIPSLNIFKLYRLSNISIGIRNDLKMVTDSEFDNIFKDFLDD